MTVGAFRCVGADVGAAVGVGVSTVAFSRFPPASRFRAGANILTVGDDLFSDKSWHCLPATTSAGENRSRGLDGGNYASNGAG